MRRNLRSLPAPAWILFAGTFVNRFGSFVLPFLILYLTGRGYPIAVAGGITGAYGIGGLAASLGGGHIADRFGRRNAIAISMFSSAAVMICLGLARPLALIAVLAVLAGATSEAYRPASSALVADLVREDARVTGFAMYRFAINLGYAVGPVLAGVLAAHSFFLLFIVDAASSCVFGGLALLALPHGVRSRDVPDQPGSYMTALRDPVLLMYCAAVFVAAFVFLQSGTNFALAVRAAGLSPQVYGLLLAINGSLIVLVELPVTAVTQRLAAVPVMMCGALIQGLGFGLIPLAAAAGTLAVTVVIWTVGEIVYSPVSAAYLAAVSPRHLRGRYAGVVGLMWGCAGVTAPTIGALLFAAAPRGLVLWSACAALSVVAAVLLRAAGGRRDARALAEATAG